MIPALFVFSRVATARAYLAVGLSTSYFNSPA
jgi:hypothetical protein